VGDLVKAQDIFNKLNSQTKEASDPYSMIALGHMYYRNISHKPAHITHAQAFFVKALRKDPRNVQAANGVALVLVEVRMSGDIYIYT